MLETDGRTQLETPDGQSADVAAPHRITDTRSWLLERVDGRIGAGVAIAWVVLTQIAVELEPRAQFELPLISVVLVISMNALLVTMVVGLVMRRRWGLLAAVASSLLLTAESIACPLTGHHHFGTWWYAQMACALALVGITVFALRRDYSAFNTES
jgi:hypothetical protein